MHVTYDQRNEFCVFIGNVMSFEISKCFESNIQLKIMFI